MDSINQFVQSPLFSKSAPIVGALALILLFWWRAGSLHSILDRVWRLTAGRTDVEDPTLKSFFQRNRELEKFRFVYRLNAQSIDQVKNLDRWLQEKSIGISQLQRVRRWVNLGEIYPISSPPTNYILGKGITFISAMFVFWAISVLNPSHIAYLQMRESGVWFRTDLKDFRAPMGGWKFAPQDCRTARKEILEKTKFLESELTSLCGSITDGTLKTLVSESLDTQKWIALFLAVLLMSTGIYNLLALKAAVEARELIRRLRELKSTPVVTTNDIEI